MLEKIFKSHKVRAILLFPLYLISKFVKRDANLWLFGPMNNAFLDNAKYLFLHVVQNHPEIKVFMVTQKKELKNDLKRQKLPVLDKWSLKGFYYGLKAGVYIISAYVDDINYWTSAGAIVFNLWHGIPLKTIEFDIKAGPLARRYQKKSLYNRIFKPYFYRRPDFVLSTSAEVSRLFASAFRVNKSQCVELGYPRTDIFFKNKKQLLNHIEKFESQQLMKWLALAENYEKVLLYMPTWRDDHSNFVQAAFPDLERLNQTLEQANTLLLIKLHPNDVSLRTFEDKSHVKTLPAKIDLYPFLPFTHGLITDYSSVYFDYMLLKKPIIFYPFDLENYLKHREMYFAYHEVVPGPVVKTFDELLVILKNFTTLQPDDRYRQLLNRFWQFQDGQSSQRVVDFLKNVVKK